MLNRINQTGLSGLNSETNKSTKKVSTISSFPELLEQESKKTKNLTQKNPIKITIGDLNTRTSQLGTAVGTNHTLGSVKLSTIFEQAAKKYDIPYKLLVSVAKAESNFNETCVSGSGAMGIMQLMPGTAKYLGVTDAYDPEQNIMGGARYLSEKLKEQKGDVKLALAAYNAGSGSVKKYGGIPPFKETQNYVKKVTEYMNSSIAVPDTMVSSRNVGETVKTADAALPAAQLAASLSQTAAKDIDQAMVVIGEGENGISLTYEAYKRYLELLNTGVG